MCSLYYSCDLLRMCSSQVDFASGPPPPPPLEPDATPSFSVSPCTKCLHLTLMWSIN